MNREVLEHYNEKLVHLTLTDGFYYKAKIEQLFDDALLIHDKKGNTVTISYKAIARIEEVAR